MANGVITGIIEGFEIERLVQRLRTSVFVRHISLTFGTRIAILIVGFASSIITARYLGPEGRGILAVLMTITGIAVQFGNFGLHTSNTYFIAKDKERLPKIIGNTLWLSLLGGALISLITLTILYFNQNIVAGIPFSLVLIALLSIPFILLFMLGQNILLGIQKIKIYNIFELINRIVTFLVVAILLILLNQGVGAVVATTTFLAAAFGLLLIKYLPVKSLIFDLRLFKEMASYGLKAYLAGLFAFLAIRFDMLMVNYFLGPGKSGIYSITVQIADLLYMLPVAIGTILFPKVSGMREGKWPFTRKVAWMTLAIMFFVCSIAALMAKPLIIFFYGNVFSEAVEALWWRLPGILMSSINTIFMNFFAGKGMPIIVVISPFLALVVNLILNIYLIPILGINGASLTSSIAYLLMLIVSIFYLKVNADVTKE